MSDTTRRSAFARRVSRAMTHALGGETVRLRIPANSGLTNADELGIVAAAYSELPLGPVVVRFGNQNKIQILVSADAMEGALQLRTQKDLRRALQDAGGLLLHGTWMLIESVEVYSMFGTAYLYQLTLHTAQGNA